MLAIRIPIAIKRSEYMKQPSVCRHA